MKIKVYGSRGSFGYSRHPHSRYGGNTSCILVETEGQALILDAGTGLIQIEAQWREFFPGYPESLPFRPDILISHLHMDHIIGLTGFGPVWNPKSGLRIFSCSRGEGSLKEQIFGAFRPPYWPVAMGETAQAECVAIHPDVPFALGKFNITPFSACHPNQTMSFYITDGHKKIAHLLDNDPEHLDYGSYKKLLQYCRDVDLVVYDAAYTQEDYEARKDWGHSTIARGVAFAEECGCRRMMFSHFSQEYSDEKLSAMEDGLDRTKFLFAYDGLELDL